MRLFQKNKKPLIYLVLRQTLPWDSISYAEFVKQSRVFCKLIGRPENQVKETVDLWNETFSYNFFDVRQSMKELSMSNFKSLKQSIFIDDIEKLKQEIDDDVLIVFTDDDDWINPDLNDYIGPNISNYDGFTWGSAAFGNRNGESIELRRNDGYCFTNNYGVVSKTIRKKMIEESLQHFKANEQFKNLNSFRISKYLSITNKHPGSTLFLEQALKFDFSSQSLIAAISNYIKVIKVIDLVLVDKLKLYWALGNMEQMKIIFERVLDSRKL
jgi:hypothetical protein